MKCRSVCLGIVLVWVPLAPAAGDVIYRVAKSSCTVELVQVEAIVKTEVRFWPIDADYERDAYYPYSFPCEWRFSWDGAGAESVDFVGVLNYGDHMTVTDAGWLGGRSVQTFSGLTHYVHGRAEWDETTRILSFKLLPRERDDGRASRVTQTAPPTCLPEGRACSAFMRTSPPLESLIITMSFTEDLGRFEGKVIATQYSGSGVTRMQSDTTIDVMGELTPQ